MLRRAVQKYEPQLSGRREGAIVAVPTNNSAVKINDMLKPAGQLSQKSIGGFTSYLSPAGIPQTSLSKGVARIKPMSADRGTNSLKRSSSEMSGFAATLHNAGSFQDPPQPIDLTGESCLPAKMATNAGLEFDLDDFDDDSDLDLDIDYPQALPPVHIGREPLQPVKLNLSQRSASQNLFRGESPKPQLPPSSAVAWSSSPPSHKETPPVVLPRRLTGEAKTVPTTLLSSEDSIDANPRPAKRRTVPWLQKEAEERQAQEQKNESKGLLEEFTTLPKNKALPWNTTASAVKQQQKALRNAKRSSVKEEELSLTDMQDIIIEHQRKKPSALCLSDEQRKVKELVIEKKKSVFFTGSAGTGKSVLMRSIIDELRRVYAAEPDRVAVTASTGLAACNIGGVTLHSFSGIGIGKEAAAELIKKINRNPRAKIRWQRTKVLIIDEISMVDGELFDKLENIARVIRKNGRHFGGIQLVITGDFFQLPPVPDSARNREVKFAFDAGTWSTVIDHTIGLTEVFRQKDPVFANMLNEMRLGRISDETVKAFKKLERPIKYEDSLDATELFPMRHEVDNANAFKMRDLVGQVYDFKAEDSGSLKDVAMRDKLLANCMAPPLLTLKKGAQVMLIKNLDTDLVNGSLGRVIAFMDEKTFEYYDKNEGPVNSDGEDETESGLALRQASKKLKALANKDFIGDTSRKLPIVRFALADGTSRDLMCQPEDWKVELPNGEVQAQRRQVPLILAWALSIHKAQGQTLQRVKVDLSRVFEKGQAYVALSRATCQEGLQVRGFDKRKVMAHPRVGEFYSSLYNVSAATAHPKVVKRPTTKKYGISEEDANDSDCLDFDAEEAMAAYG